MRDEDIQTGCLYYYENNGIVQMIRNGGGHYYTVVGITPNSVPYNFVKASDLRDNVSREELQEYLHQLYIR